MHLSLNLINLTTFFRMAYLNAWLTSFVGYTLLCSLLGWTTRGRHHTPVSVCLTGWPLHRDFSLLFARSEVGSFTCIGCDSPIHGTDGLKSPPKDLANEDKAPCQWTLLPRRDLNSCGTSSVEVRGLYRLVLRPLGHDSSSNLTTDIEEKLKIVKNLCTKSMESNCSLVITQILVEFRPERAAYKTLHN